MYPTTSYTPEYEDRIPNGLETRFIVYNMPLETQIEILKDRIDYYNEYGFSETARALEEMLDGKENS